MQRPGEGDDPLSPTLLLYGICNRHHRSVFINKLIGKSTLFHFLRNYPHQCLLENTTINNIINTITFFFTITTTFSPFECNNSIQLI